ncbi:heterokaryon incompatibility protein-domain-containing protein [Stachybotrys elegans]|uniref:Heterokaryon incompatibility protein-domain-containing protein n=1 Tax=Stachybotrys elegans TaxID=80388 RepID=A0A8K0SPW6_9HYPO|nr:heterokaryon incompatibility protein-domain-containing protein [Stachybotrys elegans]
MSSIGYHPLDIQRQEIRLLLLMPGSPGEPISCRLQSASLLESPRYHALSYVWGDPVYSNHPASQATPFAAEVNNAPTVLGANLYQALHHLRPPTAAKPLCLWVDAICINQQDEAERGSQVAIMRDIYARAEKVVIWLGQGDAQSDSAFKSLTLLASKNIEVNKDDHLDTLRQASSFFFSIADQFTWFNRVWILQELAVAQSDPLVMCGHYSIPWSVLFKAWDIIARETFVEIGMARPELLKPRDNSPADHQTNNTIHAEDDAYQRPEMKMDVLNRLRRAVRENGGDTLTRLLIISRSSKSTDIKDRIYALLGLLINDGKGIPIQIEYKKRAVEVYTDAMVYMLSRGEGLFFLAHCFLPGVDATVPLPTGTTRTGDDQDKIPSWVPDFSRQVPDNTKRTSGTPFNPPSLPGSGGASGVGANCINGKCLDDKRTLQVEGLRVDVIRRVVPLGDSLEELITKLPRLNDMWMGARGQHTDTEVFGEACAGLLNQFKNKEELWRILVSNKALRSGYDPAPESYREMYNNLLKQPTNTTAGGKSEYELSLEPGVQMRSLFVSENGFTGTCMPQTAGGDVAVILFGSPVPFILRPLGKHVSLSGSDKEVYGLVGAAYVGGIMQGEMVDELYCEDLMDSTTFLIQ